MYNKKYKIISFLVCLLLSNNTFSEISDLADVYIGGLGGVLLTEDLANNNGNLINNSISGNFKINYNTGYKLGLFLGLALPVSRFEIEVSRMRSVLEPSKDPLTSVTLTGSNTNYLIMANGIFVLPVMLVAPYVGGGVGYVHINNTFSIQSTDNVFGSQLIFGLSFNLGGYGLFIDYRKINTKYTRTLNKKYSNQTINAGLYVRIG
ncbi:MAG: hypothetical protein HRT87_12490 [Legionellales bacterium]|nr:hypothetical protein [Legionellales bacterium]